MDNNKLQESQQISLKDIVSVIWHYKLSVFLIVSLFSIVSVIYSLSLPNIYRAESLLVPVQNENAGSFGNISGQIGGLANIAGINLSQDNIDKSTLAIEILKSRKFITSFVEKHDILVNLMAAKDWNQKDNKIIIDESIYNSANDTWVREEKYPFPSKPTSWEYVKYFNEEILDIKRDENIGTVTLAVNHYSPEIAASWNRLLINEINEVMREKDILEAEMSINFLVDELERVELTSTSQVFYELMEKQVQTKMLAKVRPEYVFKIIDPAIAPKEKYKPSRAIICLIGFFIGVIFAMSYVLIKNGLKTE